MRVLLIGEYSNVHWTLAEGLRQLGHEVCVVSDGDNWKNYHRDITLKRRSNGKWDSITYMLSIARNLHRMKGFDVVQIINPMFFELKAERMRPFYDYLRRHNGKMFLCAFGMDYFWVHTCRTTDTFRYSDFNFGNRLRTDDIALREVEDWIGTAKEQLNKYIADNCDGIVTGLYEYDACYRPHYPDKTEFIPFPINTDSVVRTAPAVTDKVNFFIGIQKVRGKYKGTDVMLCALERVAERHRDTCAVVKAESVPYPVYCHMMDNSHVLLDQLYSYTPAMNGLLAMAKGLVLVGGGEEENYRILNETELRPIVNVIPDESDVEEKLEHLAAHPEIIGQLSADSRLYIERHHDYRKVAQRYVDFWNRR